MAGDACGSKQRLDIPKEVFKGFVEILAGRAIAQATVLHQFTDQLMQDVQSELQTRSLQEATQETAQQVAFMMQLIQNPETRRMIALDYGLKPSSQVVAELQTTLTNDTNDFDPDAFLLEVRQCAKSGSSHEHQAGGVGEKKSVAPGTNGLNMTIPDTKSLVKKLMSQTSLTNLNGQPS